VLLIAAAIPLTVITSQKQQEIRQRAADIIPTPPGNTVIALDAVSTGGTGVSSTSITIPHTVGAGTNRILIVNVAAPANPPFLTGTTYAGLPLTKLGTAINTIGGHDSSIWYLKNPPSGAANVIVSFSTLVIGNAAVSSWSGVDQTTPFGATATAEGGSGTNVASTATVSVTSATGEVVIDSTMLATVVTAAVGPGQTPLANFASAGSVADRILHSSEAGASTVTMSWNYNGHPTYQQYWRTLAVPLKPASVSTLTPTPTTPPGVTATPIPTSGITPTIPPGNTLLRLALGLDGLGSTGDNANPENSSGSNKNPNRKSRSATIGVFTGNGDSVANKSGTINYDTESGKFIGSVDMGTLAGGNYNVKVKSDGYLRRLAPGIQNVTAGQIYSVPAVNLVAGDINSDNAINILDYNILISCSVFSSDNHDVCDKNPDYKTLSDLDDNGAVNQFDYNLFIRELSVQKGN